MNTCFVCFGNHPQQKCPNRKLCLLCGSENTTFSCASPKRIPKMIFIHIPRQQVMRHKKLSCKYLIIHSPQLLASWPCPLPNRRSKGCESGKNVTIFCHGGSNTTCITHQSADRIKANKRNKFTLDVTSYGECRI